MKNPVSLFAQSCRMWYSLRRFPGVFSVRDASKHLRWLLQPGRITERELANFMDRELDIATRADGVHQVRLRKSGLMMYWQGQICGGLGNGILQEIDPEHPHYYSSPPVYLGASSQVLDVGACDGLFAFRVLRENLAAKVICFEPSERTAELLAQAAKNNGLDEKIQIRQFAVGASSRDVYFTDTDTPEGNKVVNALSAGTRKVRQVSLDDFCAGESIQLKCSDLIKVDAEGADVDVIKGAEGLIRRYSPQIAVTTYHDPDHARQLIEFLQSVQPRYHLRLKGFVLFEAGGVPRPVLLQAALPESRLESQKP